MIKLFQFLILSSLLSLLFVVDSQAQNEELIVIANSQGAPAEMKKSYVKKVLRGQRPRWKDGSKVKLCLMKTRTPMGTKTAKEYYNMTGRQLNKYWLALVFQGKSSPPHFFNTQEELKSYVLNNSGAIGVIAKKNKASAREINILSR